MSSAGGQIPQARRKLVPPLLDDRTLPDRITRTFRADDLQREFSRSGYVVVDFFCADEVGRLRGEVEDLYPPTLGFATSVEIADEPYRRRVHQTISNAFRSRADSLLLDHEMNLTAVAIKHPGADGFKPLHQDWTFSDETRFRSVNVWVPLVDTDADNGALAVLPGSHKALSRLRPAPRFPSDYVDPVADLDLADLESVDLVAGQAIVMDLALIHGSPVNRGEEPRVVVAANFLPRASPISFFYCGDDDRVERFDVPDAAFFQRFDWRRPPDELASHGIVPFRPKPQTAAEIIASSRLVSAADA